MLVGIAGVATVGAQWWTLIWFILAPLEYFNLLSLTPLVTRYRFRRNPKFNAPSHLTFGEDGIHFTTTGIDSRLDWRYYDGVLEDDQLFLLTYAGPAYSVIPKRCFPDAETMDAFRQLVDVKITR